MATITTADICCSERRIKMNTILCAVNAALFIAVTVALVFKYRQSQQSEFIWLAIPLVLLPLLSLPITEWLKVSVDRLSTGDPNVTFPFTLVESGRITLGNLLVFWNGVSHIIWSAFVLVGILMLLQSRRQGRNH